jgi:hypothetical protein
MYNLEQVYEQSAEVVRAKGLTESEAKLFYTDYLNFITTLCPEKGNLLDVGCGAGWSSFHKRLSHLLLSDYGF